MAFDSLRTDRSFQRLRAGRSGRGRLLAVRWLPAPAQAPLPRVGLVVSRKVGKAVVRNLIRRRLREILRRLSLPRVDLLVVVYPEAAQASFVEVWKDLMHALRRSGLIQ